MNFNNPDYNNSTVSIRLLCAIVFCLFTFLYVYVYQSAILAVGQHVLSDGATQYHPFIAALMFVVMLQGLQLGIYVLTGLSRRAHALTYFPSALILAILSDINTDIDLHFSFGHWLWVAPLLIVVWIGAICFCRQFQPYEPDINSRGILSRMSWNNILQLVIMLFLVALIGNSNDAFHYRARVEQCLLDGDAEKALLQGDQSLSTDSSLTLVRVFALSKANQLPSRLFSYPLKGGSTSMIPGCNARLLMLPADSLYRHLGASPRAGMGTYTYLYALLNSKSRQATPAVADYLLCAYLLDRKLDAFVHLLPRYYHINSHLPRHYKEALTLYNHLRSKPVVNWQDALMETNFTDYQTLEKQYRIPNERKLQVRTQYGDTYWYYYEYER